MVDPSLFQEFMNRRSIKTPAFNFVPGAGFQPTQQAQQVVDLLNQTSGKQFNLQPANSVMAIQGEPMWGTGHGVVWHDTPTDATGYIDPLGGTAHTVAHEGAHAVMPSSLKTFQLNQPTMFSINPYQIPRDTGQRLRWAHETYGKPNLVEETHAQGVAQAALNQLGIPYEESVSDYGNNPLGYPSTKVPAGISFYAQHEVGPPSPYEQREIKRIFGAADPLMNRVFQQGQSLIR